jgi:hypothetical protein
VEPFLASDNIIVFFQACLCAVVMSAVDPQCQALIDANSQSVDLITSIQVEYTIASPGNPEPPWDRISWARRGTRERIQRVANAAGGSPDGRPLGISDELLDGPISKHLTNWDPAEPQKITPTRQGTVRATVAPRTTVNAELVTPSENLLFEIDRNPRRTLAELAEVAPKVTCKGKVNVNGNQLWLLSLESPEETTSTTTKKYFDVYLDPQAGYMVRKVAVRAPKVILGNGQTTSYEYSREVIDFENLGDGVFVPTKVRNSIRDKWMSEVQVESIKVNESIPAETFQMNWPKYAQIRHLPPVDGKVRVEVWGDGRPIRDIANNDDVRTLEAELRKDPAIAAELGPLLGAALPPPASTMVKLSIGLAVLVVIMVTLIIWRRIREQAA